jgi:hypothetical protein
MAPKEFTVAKKKKQLVVRTADYQLIAGHLYKLGADVILKRSVMDHERSMVLAKAHEGITRGKYVEKSTS